MKKPTTYLPSPLPPPGAPSLPDVQTTRRVLQVWKGLYYNTEINMTAYYTPKFYLQGEQPHQVLRGNNNNNNNNK